MSLANTSDHTGRLRGLWVSSGAQTPGTATGDLYTRTYTWQADQVVRTDSCALGATVPHTETYGYDALLRLTSAGRPLGGAMADVGGPFDSRSYGYDGRGNRTSQVNEDCAYTLTYGASGHPDELTQRASACTSAMLKHTYAYDRDGRVSSKTWAQKLDGSTPYAMLFGSGETDSSSNGALDSVLKSVSVAGAVYNYFYDAFNRRRLKVYPTGNTDEFFHSMNNELLVDRGLSSVTSPTAFPIDEYVWLGGRPVILIRGQLSTGFARQSDATTNCARNGDAAACGAYFPITDHIGKPVLMLDANRKVAGIGEYDPFGQLNRVSLDKESVHPYSPTPPATTTLADFKQPVGSSANPSTVFSLRALIHLAGIRTYTTLGSGVGIHHIPPSSFYTATLSLVDGDTSSNLWSSTGGGANFFTSWVQPSAGHAKLNFTTNGWPTCAVGDDPPDFSLCTGSGSFSDDLTGVVMESFEYRRYQSGSAWFWTPLRFPGQYYDPETDLAQNWNRFYDSAKGRYFEIDPLMPRPHLSLLSGRLGRTAPLYGYANNNPLHFKDVNGKYISVGGGFAGYTFLPGGCSGPGLCHGGDTSIDSSWSPVGVCRARSDCTYGFDVNVHYLISTIIFGLPSAPSPGTGGSILDHENQHIEDLEELMAAINSEIETEGFSSQDECNSARGRFGSVFREYIIWILAQTAQRDWWNVAY